VTLPFTLDQFARVFIDYNDAIWPVQVLAWTLGATTLGVAYIDRAWSARFVLAALALMWMWIGIAYHILHFAQINRTALAFGGAFIAEAVLFLLVAFRSPRLSFRFSRSMADAVACGLIVFGLVVYPLITLLWSHPYPATPMFGTTPCPTVIFTFGVLLLAKPRFSGWLFIIPAAWAIIGGSAAILLNVPEDFGLFAALASWIVLAKSWRPKGKQARAA
jgi:hypothetical protein